MKASEKTFGEIKDLNREYQGGVLRVSHREYLKQYDRLKRRYKSQLRDEQNRPTLSTVINRFGAKSEKIMSGYYRYVGVNFTVEYNEDSCETTWWEVNLFGDDIDQRVVAEFEDYNYYDRKSDVLSALFGLDQKISESK